MLFEEKKAVRAAVSRVLELLRKHERGDTIPWPAIEAAAGFERYTRHWSAFFRRLRRDFLRETGICLWPVVRVGMELLSVQDQLVRRSVARRRKAARQFRRDEQELRAMRLEEMTLGQQAIRFRQLESAELGRSDAERQLRNAHKIGKPTSSGLPHPSLVAGRV